MPRQLRVPQKGASSLCTPLSKSIACGPSGDLPDIKITRVVEKNLKLLKPNNKAAGCDNMSLRILGKLADVIDIPLTILYLRVVPQQNGDMQTLHQSTKGQMILVFTLISSGNTLAS